MRMRNLQNQPLELSTLFLYSKQQVEHVQMYQQQQQQQGCQNLNMSSSGFYSSSADLTQASNNPNVTTNAPLILFTTGSSSSKIKHKQFKLNVYGINEIRDNVNEHEFNNNMNNKSNTTDSKTNNTNSIQVKVTQETTVQQVIEQILSKIDKNSLSSFREKKNFYLVQQVERRWSNSNNSGGGGAAAAGLNDKSEKSGDSQQPQRNSWFRHQRTKSFSVFYNASILNYARQMASDNAKRVDKNGSNQYSPKDVKCLQYHEKIMEVQNKWTGNGRFIIKKKIIFSVSKRIFSLFHFIILKFKTIYKALRHEISREIMLFLKKFFKLKFY